MTESTQTSPQDPTTVPVTVPPPDDPTTPQPDGGMGPHSAGTGITTDGGMGPHS
jgi:hypothetical protein